MGKKKPQSSTVTSQFIQESDSDEDISEFTKSFMSKVQKPSKHLNQIDNDERDCDQTENAKNALLENFSNESAEGYSDHDDFQESGSDQNSDSADNNYPSNTLPSIGKHTKAYAHQSSSDEEMETETLRHSNFRTAARKARNTEAFLGNSSEGSQSNVNQKDQDVDSSEDDANSSSSDQDSGPYDDDKMQLEDNELGNDDEEADYEKIRAEIADMPFEELQKLKETVGIKMFNQAMSKGVFNKTKKHTFTRENKNRPMEMSSKRPAQTLRKALGKKKKVTRDPRFDDLSGEFNETYFKQAYSFLSDVKSREKQSLIKKFKKEKDDEKKAKLDDMIKRLTQQEKAAREKETKAKKDRHWKQKQSELVKEGKNPYYLKKSTKKTLELADKFQELKKSGKIENYLSKKRKKNAMKERKRLPMKI